MIQPPRALRLGDHPGEVAKGFRTRNGEREIDGSLLGGMARQSKLSRADLEQLIACPLNRDSYEAKLVAQGMVEAQTD